MPAAIRDRRRTLRYRHLLVRQMVQMKNRVSGLLMETGVEYNKQRLHKVSYFRELLSGKRGGSFELTATVEAQPGDDRASATAASAEMSGVRPTRRCACRSRSSETSTSSVRW